MNALGLQGANACQTIVCLYPNDSVPIRQQLCAYTQIESPKFLKPTWVTALHHASNFNISPKEIANTPKVIANTPKEI